jgi:hypothetical protein
MARVCWLRGSLSRVLRLAGRTEAEQEHSSLIGRVGLLALSRGVSLHVEGFAALVVYLQMQSATYGP